MSTMDAAGVRAGRVDRNTSSGVRRLTETKSFAKTSEFFVWILAVAATIIATYAKDSDSLQPRQGWLYVAILSAAYMLSRGLAKAGSYEPYSEDRSAHSS
jgi:hypothetical protein